MKPCFKISPAPCTTLVQMYSKIRVESVHICQVWCSRDPLTLYKFSEMNAHPIIMLWKWFHSTRMWTSSLLLCLFYCSGASTLQWPRKNTFTDNGYIGSKQWTTCKRLRSFQIQKYLINITIPKVLVYIVPGLMNLVKIFSKLPVGPNSN